MADTHVERKRVNPFWIAVFIILIIAAAWLVWEMLDTEEPVEAAPVAAIEPAAPLETPVAPAITEPVAPEPRFVPPEVAPEPLAPELRSPYVGTFVSDSIRLVVNNDGTYTITESPAGEGRGPWTVLPEYNVLLLDPADGSQDRYFRIQDPDTLVPLNPTGEQPAQMTKLLRREQTGETGLAES